MATANFNKQNYFNLLVNDFIYYENEDGEQCFDEYLYEDTQEFLEQHNSNLTFFTITLKSGYYAGEQAYITTNYSDYVDFIDFLENYNDYDGQYIYKLFGYNKHILKLKILKEIDNINNNILPQLVDCYGFTQLRVVGTFSNGETIYERI